MLIPYYRVIRYGRVADQIRVHMVDWFFWKRNSSGTMAVRCLRVLLGPYLCIFTSLLAFLILIHSCIGVREKQNLIALFWEVINEVINIFLCTSKSCPKNPNSLQSDISIFRVQHWQLPSLSRHIWFCLTWLISSLLTAGKCRAEVCKF